MLYILGVGGAYPPNVVPQGLCGETTSTVRSTLPLDYLERSGNETPREAPSVAQGTPTSLGVEAVQQALQRASLGVEAVHLVIGDSSTPYQTTPSEGQRVAGALGLKVPAYDVMGAASTFALHCDLLSSWRPERVPDFTVLLSANTPTQLINYRRGESRRYFSDGAGAAVLSTSQRGKLRVRDTFVHNESSDGGAVGATVFQHIDALPEARETIMRGVGEMLQQALETNRLNAVDVRLVTSCLTFEDAAAIGERAGVLASSLWDAHALNGFSIGAAPLVSIAQRWATINRGETIVVALAGFGGGRGYVVLEGV